MLSIISPAKTMNFKQKNQILAASTAQNEVTTQLILVQLKSLAVETIMQIMKVSRRIAELNYYRFQNFFNLPEKSALLAYNGDVYNHIDINSLDENDLNFAQDHLGILSALYGLLKPLDLIRAYRLEMSTKLEGIAAKGMYLFWREIITEQLNILLNKHENKFLINLASQEYSAAIDTKKLTAKMINIHFRENRKGELKNIPIRAKYARGMMTDFIIRNQIDHPDDLKSFGHQAYHFNLKLSDEANFYYLFEKQENIDD